MVQPILKGRMGNQMFQIAAAIGYADKHVMQYYVPQQTADPDKWPVYFNHFPRHTREGVITGTIYRENENEFEYHEIPPRSHIFLDGYFQSEKYFAHCEHRIRNAFGIQPIESDLDHAVSLHVRRGDYLNHPDHHPVLNLDYYARAIELFKEKGFHFFEIFSDDMDWCIDNINCFNFKGVSFGYKGGAGGATIAKAHLHMGMMAGCEHHIISNSSYAWWGAWLNPHQQKIVVAPEKWFGPALSHLDTKDLLPKNWIKI